MILPLNFALKAHFQMGTIFFTGSMQPDDKDTNPGHHKPGI